MKNRFRYFNAPLRDHDLRTQASVFASLLFSTVLCLGLLTLRSSWYRSPGLGWMDWNLFLAWLPALGACAAYNLSRLRSRLCWPLILGFSTLWLLFLPNAPYLVTDIIHLQSYPSVPLWYDLVLLVAAAWTGSFLGLVSLFLMQSMVRNVAGKTASWIFVAAVMALTGFGIYFGRVLRWNSWDLLFRPSGMIAEMIDGILHPFEHVQTFLFAGLFALLFGAVYLTLLSFTNLQIAHRKPNE